MEALRRIFGLSPRRTDLDEGNFIGRWVSKFPDSQDFENVESIEWRKHELRQFADDEGKVFTQDRILLIMNWISVTSVGVFCGIVGFLVHTATYSLLSMKTSYTEYFLDNGHWAEAFIVHFAFGFTFTVLAFVFVLFDINAAGSGLPEVKCFLNGINLDKIVQVKTLYCKTFSVIFTVASGLFAGPEGPMVHIGAIIGACTSRMYHHLLNFNSNWATVNVIRTDAVSRDFVTFGVAAGIAAAFRAPIGGVLFSLEEGASFWSTGVTWQAFFCCSVTLITVILIDRAVHYDGVNNSSNFSFGKFSEEKNKNNSDYFLYELPLFFLIGCVGGMLGALYVKLNYFLSIGRIRFIGDARWKRLIEIIIICTITAWSTFTVPLMWRICSRIPEVLDSFSDQEKELIDHLVQFDCPLGQYNQVASLLYVDSNTAIKQLLHFREHMSSETFNVGSLFVFFLPHFLIYCATCGVMASAGVFVPSLLSGACMGRIFGSMLNAAFPGLVADSGTYALIGAAAMLGGVCRMTIALTVILVEVTGNLQYVLPLMLTLLASRYTGNVFSPGLYDQIVHLKQLPYLEESLNTIGLVNTCPISEFMARPVVVLKELERVSNVIEALTATTYNLFPVLDTEGRLKGACFRSTLLGILQTRSFSVPLAAHDGDSQIEVVPVPGKEENIGWTIGLDGFKVRKSPNIEAIRVSEEEEKLWVDLRRYMDTAPHTILENTSVKRAYRMFRTMGLRHIIVIDGNCKVSGMITRKDLTEERLHQWLNAFGRSHRGKGLDIIYGLEQLNPLLVRLDEEGEVIDELSPVSKQSVRATSSREILQLEEEMTNMNVGSPRRSSRLVSNGTINESSAHSGNSIASIMSNYYSRGVVRWADEKGQELDVIHPFDLR